MLRRLAGRLPHGAFLLRAGLNSAALLPLVSGQSRTARLARCASQPRQSNLPARRNCPTRRSCRRPIRRRKPKRQSTESKGHKPRRSCFPSQPELKHCSASTRGARGAPAQRASSAACLSQSVRAAQGPYRGLPARWKGQVKRLGEPRSGYPLLLRSLTQCKPIALCLHRDAEEIPLERDAGLDCGLYLCFVVGGNSHRLLRYLDSGLSKGEIEIVSRAADATLSQGSSQRPNANSQWYFHGVRPRELTGA